MECVKREDEEQEHGLTEINSFAKDHIIDRFFIIEGMQNQLEENELSDNEHKTFEKAAKDCIANIDEYPDQLQIKESQDREISEDFEKSCFKVMHNSFQEGTSNEQPYVENDDCEARIEEEKSSLDSVVKIEDILDASCWEELIRDYVEDSEEIKEEKEDDDDERLMQVAEQAMESTLNYEEHQIKDGMNIFEYEDSIGKNQNDEVSIQLELASEEKLTIKLSQEVPPNFKLGGDAITTFYLSHCQSEEEDEKITRSSASSENTSFVEEDIIETFVRIENNGQLIQDWEKQQELKKSCFVTISEDLQIVENITDSMAKSPDVDAVCDLVESVKAEPMTALDLFINTELADVQEIKQGLNILSFALTSPGLVR